MKAAALQERLADQRPDPRSGMMALAEFVAEKARCRDSPLFALRLFRRLRPLLRHLVLEKLREFYPNPDDLSCRPEHDPAIHHDFMNLAERLGVVIRRSGSLHGTSRFTRGGAWVGDCRDEAAYHETLTLLESAEGPSAPPVFQRHDVRYLVPVLNYARYLEHLRFDGRIGAMCEESFYSDLGALAYELYTGDVFRAMITSLDVRTVADIGCGEGDHIADVRALQPLARCIGYERNPEVATRADARFADDPMVEVRTLDIREANSDGRTFDLVLSIYMLFYLNDADRVALLRHVAEMLSDDGVYIVGQYFPDVDDIQAAFTRRWWDPTESYMRLVSSSMLSAEVLINRILDDFESVIYWPEFLAEVEGAGLVVEDVVASDQYAYSYFITLRRAHPRGRVDVR